MALQRWIRMVVLLVVFSCPGALQAAEVKPGETANGHVPGVALSQGITEITGVAISPLLGVSTVGAYRYWKAPAERRAQFPWFCQPWAWGTGLSLLGLCFLKDSLGVAVPGILKKPFDMVELLESKLSALVASAAFVPLVVREMSPPETLPVPAAAIGGLGMVDAGIWWLLVPVMVISFLAVWLCSHALNVLIILSPFSTVDAAIKLMRMMSLVLLGIIYWIAPWLAAVCCVGIVLAAFWLAPAAMRLAIFGTRYALDVLLPWRARKRADLERPHVFTLGRMSGLPARTGGRLVKLEDGTMVFRYRRAMVLDVRSVPVPEGILKVEKGLLSPSLVLQPGAGLREGRVLLFLPRYRGREQELVGTFELQGVRDHALLRGFKSVISWLREMVRPGAAAASGNQMQGGV